MTSSAAEKILSGLDEQQKVAAKALVGPTVILAGAGTGKTRTVTHRIAYGIATASRIGTDLHKPGSRRVTLAS